MTGRASRVVARSRDGEESVYEADAVIFSVGVTGLEPHSHRSPVPCPATHLYLHGSCIKTALPRQQRRNMMHTPWLAYDEEIFCLLTQAIGLVQYHSVTAGTRFSSTTGKLCRARRHAEDHSRVASTVDPRRLRGHQ